MHPRLFGPVYMTYNLVIVLYGSLDIDTAFMICSINIDWDKRASGDMGRKKAVKLRWTALICCQERRQPPNPASKDYIDWSMQQSDADEAVNDH